MRLCFQRNLITFTKIHPSQMIFITTSLSRSRVASQTPSLWQRHRCRLCTFYIDDPLPHVVSLHPESQSKHQQQKKGQPIMMTLLWWNWGEDCFKMFNVHERLLGRRIWTWYRREYGLLTIIYYGDFLSSLSLVSSHSRGIPYSV